MKLRGTFEELTTKSFYENTVYSDSYLSITLTDEEELPDVIGTLRKIYPYMMQVSYDNARTRSTQQVAANAEAERRSPLQSFFALIESQNGRPMSQEQTDFVGALIDSIWEAEV